MPILGVIASSITGGLSVGGSFESIATQTVGAGGAASVTFSSIPSTYTHLQIRAIARSTRTGATQTTFRFRINSDSALNYSYHRMFVDTTYTWAFDGLANQSYGYLFNGATTSDATANLFGSSIWTIYDYKNTNKYKTIGYLGNINLANSSGWIGIGSSVWQNTNAVSDITISPDGGFDFTQYSSFALYGMKVA